MYSLKSLQAKLGPSMCQQILVLHTFGGSDTTSAICGHGKGTLFNSLATNCRLSSFVNDLQNQEAAQEKAGKAGLQLFLTLYGGKPSDSLSYLGHAAYCHLVSKSLGKLQPKKLPPTEATHWEYICKQLSGNCCLRVVWCLLTGDGCVKVNDWFLFLSLIHIWRCRRRG